MNTLLVKTFLMKEKVKEFFVKESGEVNVVAIIVLIAVAIAIAITPLLLPVILSSSLAKGAVKMAHKNTIVKKLFSVLQQQYMETQKLYQSKKIFLYLQQIHMEAQN